MAGELTGIPDAARTPVRPFSGAPSLAWTFVLAGVAYALPFLLFPKDYPLNGPVSPEILNLNFLVAWMGLAHFAFAYSGQAGTLRRAGGATSGMFCASLVLGGAALVLLRKAIGLRFFDFVVWIYFIPHFIKAELHFIRNTRPNLLPRAWVLYWFPALGFAFFTFALFGPALLSYRSGLLVGLAILCVAGGLSGGILQRLSNPDHAPYALLGFFFIGEGLVWGAYSKYMTPQFRQGLYVFHIAVASFYHYFRAYDFALHKIPSDDVARQLRTIALVNLLLIVIGSCVVFQPQWRFAQLLFGLPWFTFWVGLHLVASDIFTAFRRHSWQRS